MLTGAYYFRAHMYTLVPDQVRQDLDWMAANGASMVVLGILEQDFAAARENIDFVCAEAEKRGIEVWATPSRWGNLVAGCPKVPSILCARKIDCWARHADGSPCMGFLGPFASVHAAETKEAFERMLADLLGFWPIKGIVWDEFKALEVRDYSDAARVALGERVDDPDTQLSGQAGFFGQLNRFIKALSPQVRTAAFVFSNMDQRLIEAAAGMGGLDYFGCDGRPWALADGGADDTDPQRAPSKLLIDHGPRFTGLARRHGIGSMALVENHALPDSSLPLMERRLPEVLSLGWDLLLYYYYPRSCPSPGLNMEIIARALRDRL